MTLNPKHRTYAVSAVVVFLSLACGSSSAAERDESKEPPLQYVVNINDKTITVTDGEKSQLTGAFTNPIISVTPQPYRVFPYQGINFKYPRAFTFEAKLSGPEGKTWTLSGNDFKIMYFVMDTPLKPSDFANNMIAQFGPEKCKVIDASAQITLGKQTLSGTTIEITVATQKIVIDAYGVPAQGTTSKLLVFQDSLDNKGDRSSEGQQTLKELQSSFSTGR